jgi:phage terminase large subunit-like protein
LREKSRSDRVPYDVWHADGQLKTTPGKAVEYEWVARWLYEHCANIQFRIKIAFDRWGMKHLKPWLIKAGFTEEQFEQIFVEFGQGFQSMSPALRDTESALLSGKVRHGNHPVLSMCAANAVVTTDPAGGRKLNKAKSATRIDGMVALAMAFGIAPNEVEPAPSFEIMVF